MKKFPLLSILVIAGLMGAFGLLHQNASQTHAPALVPEDASVFIHLPDLRKTRTRWTKTALHRIAQEPEVREFLEKPKSQSQDLATLRSCWKDFLLADPLEAFLAVRNDKTDKAPKQTLPPPELPPFVAGALCMGDKGKVGALIARAEKEMQKGQAEVQRTSLSHQGVSIETITQGETTMAIAWVGRWILVGNQVEFIKQTIDRALPHRGLGLMKDSPDFRQCMERMPQNPDFVTFIRPATASAMQGPAFGWSDLAALKSIKALCLGLKMDGSDLRDAFFALMDSPLAANSAKTEGLSRRPLQLAHANTLLFFASHLDLQQIPGKLAQLPRLPLFQGGGLAEFQAGLAAQDVTPQRIASMLGSQFAFVLNWDPLAMHPSLLLALDLKEPAKATQLLELLTSGTLGNTPWEHARKEGAEIFSIRPLPMVAPTFAIKDQKLIFSLDPDTINSAVRAPSGNPSQTGTQGRNSWFNQAEARTNHPTHSLGYVDSKQLFEQIYGLSRPFIMLWGGLNPKVRNTLDLSKLPTTDCIGQHLSPITFSSAWVSGGFLAESRGPITLHQAAIALGLGSGAALIPKLAPANAVLFPPKAARFAAKATPSAPTAGPVPEDSPAEPAP